MTLPIRARSGLMSYTAVPPGQQMVKPKRMFFSARRYFSSSSGPQEAEPRPGVLIVDPDVDQPVGRQLVGVGGPGQGLSAVLGDVDLKRPVRLEPEGPVSSSHLQPAWLPCSWGMM